MSSVTDIPTNKRTPSMDSAFKKNIVECSKDFVSKECYRTITRKNGSEIITYSNGKITLTKLAPALDGKNSTSEVTSKITFQPVEILLNQSEELLCAYDEKNVWAFTLNKEGSKINFTVTYKVELGLVKNEKVLQAIFNNVSKYQAELVILTTNEIKSFNLNVSLKVPTQRFDFKKEYEKNVSTSKSSNFDFDSSIVDPVSICFASSSIHPDFKSGSNNSPQNDITLFLLTSDASIYKIYPFFPSELSVSKEWLTDLFDSTTILFKSFDNEIEQSTLLSSVKVAAILAQSSNSESIYIRKELPLIYQRGKVTGPITIETFPEDLYSFNAIKLLSLPNDIMVIVFDFGIVVFNRNTSCRMIFENQSVEPDDKLLLLDSIMFSPNNGTICTAQIHPVSHDSIFVTASNGSLIQIDFSQWMDSLSSGLETGDLSEFTKLCESGQLPTEILSLNKMYLPNEIETKSEVPLRSHENNIWFAWNTREVYVMVLKAGSPEILSTSLISKAIDTVDDNIENEEFIKKNGSDSESLKSEYKSLLVGEFKTTVLPQVQTALSKITEINNAMTKFPTTVLNEQSTTATELKTVHTLTELASSGQLILFRILSLLSRRLKLMSMEYHNQINTYHSIILRKEKVLSDFFRLKTAFAESADRQNKLVVKMSKLMSNTELLESKNNMKSISISYQENAYFRELARIRDFVIRKETELEQLNGMLSDVRNAEMGVLFKNKEEVLKDFNNKKSLEALKQNLEIQSTFISHLCERLNEIKLVEL